MKQKHIAWIIALVMMCTTFISQSTLAVNETNSMQISKNEDSYNYHDLKKDGSTETVTNEALNKHESDKGTITTSKTIESTNVENEFVINLQVTSTENFNEIELSDDAAVVLVIDCSGSMQWDLNGGGYCEITSCSGYGKYFSGGSHSWEHLWGRPSRFEVMCDSLIGTSTSKGFLDSFVEDAGDAQRLVSVVTFGGNTQYTTTLGWTDVTTETGMNTVKNEVSFETLTSHIRSQTSPGNGLDEAITLLKDDATLKDIPNKYVILLTDGRPEGTTNINNGTHTVERANKVKDECNAILYSIGFGTKDIAMLDGSGTKVNEWLANSVSSEGCFIAAQSGTELDLGLKNISQTIKTVANAWHVIDPMGENITFDGFVSDTPNVTYDNNTINWDLNKENVNLIDGKYTYNLKYKIRLDNTKNGFQEEKFYLTNGYTDLSYFFVEEVIEDGKIIASNTSVVRNINFKVPAVKGYLGDLYVNKIASDDRADFLEGAKFELVHCAEDCTVCKGKVSIADFHSTTKNSAEVPLFTNVPSGHDYILKETEAPIGYLLSDKEYAVKISYGKVFVDDEENTSTVPTVIENKLETIDIDGIKVWDENGMSDLRPEEITINLYADGNLIETTKTSESNGWSWTFTELPKYSDGKVVVYTVKESDVPDNYESKVTGNTVDGFVITNTLKKTSVEVDKTVSGGWGDIDKEFEFVARILPKTDSTAGIELSGITIEKNGTLTTLNNTTKIVFTLKHGEHVTINNLPVGFYLQLKETNANTYDITINNTEATNDSYIQIGKLSESKTTVNVVNNKEAIIDTGIDFDSPVLPIILLSFVCVSGIVGVKMYLTNERKRRYGR